MAAAAPAAAAAAAASSEEPVLFTVTSPTNIAVIKYWGKRDAGPLNLPLNGSLSACLHQDELRTRTSAYATPPSKKAGASTSDDEPTARLVLNGQPEVAAEGRLAAVVKAMRARARVRADWDVLVVSENNFPTAAGLASSASGFAALAAVLAKVFGVPLGEDDCSDVARMGSGSACRSVLPGWVKWEVGTQADGSDSRAALVADDLHWPEMRVAVLVVSDARKDTPSTAGMQASVATSAMLKDRAENIVPQRLKAMEEAIAARDFATFAELTMRDSDSFHDVCADTTPPIHYLTDASRAIIALVNAYNASNGAGTGVAYTFDAGPNAVIYALADHIAPFLALALRFLGGNSIADAPNAVPAPEPAAAAGAVADQTGFLRCTPPTREAIATAAKEAEAEAQPAGEADATKRPSIAPILKSADAPTPRVPTDETSPLKYILVTRVGPGPRELTADDDHLIDAATGLPK